MTALIKELEQEHTQVLRILTELRDLGCASKEGAERLFSFRTALLEHLQKEDERLYGPLRKKAERDPQLQGTLDVFAKDVEQVSTVVANFFNTYTGRGADVASETQIIGLATAIAERIQRERSVLYAEYEKLQAASPPA